jgi:hypothetical protein
MNTDEIIEAMIAGSRSRAIKYIINDYRWYKKEINNKRSLKSFCSDLYNAETSNKLMKKYNLSVEDIEKYMLLL